MVRLPENREWLTHKTRDRAAALTTPPPEVSSAVEGLRYIRSRARICSIPMIEWSKAFVDEIRAEAANDPQYQQGLRAVSDRAATDRAASDHRAVSDHRATTKTNYRGEPPIASIDDGLLYHKLRLYDRRDYSKRLCSPSTTVGSQAISAKTIQSS